MLMVGASVDVPERQRKILEESHAELNIIDEDTGEEASFPLSASPPYLIIIIIIVDKIQVRSQLSDMSIVLAPNRQVRGVHTTCTDRLRTENIV
jgi:hypothetical protein